VSNSILEFDIFLTNTSKDNINLDYAAGQYFLEVNNNFIGSANLMYSIVNSSLPDAVRPLNPTVEKNLLKLAANQISADQEARTILSSGKNEILIATLRLESSKDFRNKDHGLKFSEGVFKTKIIVFDNNLLTDITDNGSHYDASELNYKNSFIENESVIESYALSQNYPNPFNPSTKISFSIPVDGNVVLSIFDIAGREVVTLVNEFKSSGNYSEEFNAHNLSSGIYFYKITSGNFTEVRKMTLLK
jgi:hypothetical protein